MSMHYHTKGESRTKKNKPSASDRGWYKRWWQAEVNRLRVKVAQGKYSQTALDEDLAYAQKWGVS